MREKPGLDKDGPHLAGNMILWVDDDSLVYILDKFIDAFINQETIQLDGKTVEYNKGKKNIGERPYGAGGLLKLFIYGYYNRISSSYRLATEARRNVEVSYLLRGLKPSRHTISDFRLHNGQLIKAAFLYLNEQLCKNKIMFSKNTCISIDGTKIKANANSTAEKHIERWKEKLQKKMENYIESTSNEDSDSEILSEELKNQKEEHEKETAAMQEQIASLTKELEDFKKTGVASPTIAEKLGNRDMDCKAMIHKDKSVQPSYNVQVSTDNESHCIVTNEVTTEANDINLLKSDVDQVTEFTGEMPEEVNADNGYANTGQMQEIEKESLEQTGKETRLYIPFYPTAAEKNDIENGVTFTPNKENDGQVCSQGVTLEFKEERIKRGRKYKVYQAKLEDCKACPLYGSCTKAKTTGRSIWIGDDLPYKIRHGEKMSTKEAQEKINKRKGKIENVFGTLKTWMGKLPFLLRGKKKVSIEMDLYCIAYNLRRTVSICTEQGIKLSF